MPGHGCSCSAVCFYVTCVILVVSSGAFTVPSSLTPAATRPAYGYPRAISKRERLPQVTQLKCESQNSRWKEMDGFSALHDSRRNILGSMFGLGLALLPVETGAKEPINDCEPYKPGMKFLPGKSCQAKGSDNQPKDPKGTKKDPKYLRALQDCRAKCQAPAGKVAEQSSNECIKACRDEVCTTYEQCTYQIGPKEDYGGEWPEDTQIALAGPQAL